MLKQNQQTLTDEHLTLSAEDFELIEGLLFSNELYISPYLHQETQLIMERSVCLKVQDTGFEMEEGFSTKLSDYDSFALSLSESTHCDRAGPAKLVIELDEVSSTSSLYYEVEKSSRDCLAQSEELCEILLRLVDVVKNSSIVYCCPECQEYGLVANLVGGKWRL
ncbi:hypothetical protein [Vibrio agarivorans]|uniref:Uncharacterized protein n=1 Tax=Vibrio agarivorans TaxID=153622 RepID=A0ABT7Y5W5_9VIBR|nr:hypothetical protein [Vibrio agarivorans]MDN2483446.1 hypothetical protein [Vibrio agarivorans]